LYPYNLNTKLTAIGALTFLWQANSLFLLWLARSHQRRDLENLSDAALRDIGLTRLDVEQEVAKPFWQA